MQKDAHYYAVLAFARACGFKKEAAHTIAYASQFVDDSKINHIVANGRREDLAGAEVENDYTHFIDMATCHQYFRFKTLNYSAMTCNTCAFHFVPGCDEKLVPQKFICKKKSQVINRIVSESIDDNEDNVLEKLGMVLHVYADSFSHHNFVGLPSKVNDIAKPKLISPIFSIKRLGLPTIRSFFREQLRKIDMAIPPYGHGQAYSFPDLAHITWKYKYDSTKKLIGVDKKGYDDFKTREVNNKLQFTEAFEEIKSHLEHFIAKHEDFKDRKWFKPNGSSKFENFNDLFKILTADAFSQYFKVEKWKKALIDFKLFDNTDVNYIKYNKHRWLRDAFKNYNERRFNRRSVADVELKKGFENSNWYRFYKAVHWYKPKFFKYCKEFGLYIPNNY